MGGSRRGWVGPSARPPAAAGGAQTHAGLEDAHDAALQQQQGHFV
jgi:hypothetical protein